MKNKKEKKKGNNNESIASTGLKQSVAIKNYVDIDPKSTDKIKSDPLPIAQWESIHITSINAIEKSIVSAQPVQKIIK